jgi:hypothetical protein
LGERGSGGRPRRVHGGAQPADGSRTSSVIQNW